MSIKSEISRIAAAKAAIRDAINEKGGTLDGELLDEYAGAIRSLPESGGGTDLSGITAGAEDILLGKVSVNADGETITGTIADAVLVNDGETLSISAGYNRTAQTFFLTSASGTDITYGYLDENGKFQALDLAGELPVKSGDAEDISNFGIYQTGTGEPEFSGSVSASGVYFGYVTEKGTIQKIDLSGDEPLALGLPELMEVFLVKSGVDEPDYGKAEE